MSPAVPFADLTPRQRDCLRLVNDGYKSKQIGQMLQISHHTVDEYLKGAIKLLGADDRHSAARLFAAWERDKLPPQRLGAQADTLAEPAPNLPKTPPKPSERPARWQVPFLRQGRQHNDLRPAQRLFWIGGLALLILFGAANLLNGIGAARSIALALTAH